MKKFEWFMGIDVSKKKLDVTILKGIEKVHYQEIDNDMKSINLFVKSLTNLHGFEFSKCLVCMEHTGIYNANLLRIADIKKWNLCLESAVQIKQSIGLQRGKNDEIDSYRIAMYAYKQADFIKLWKPVRKVIVTL